MFCFAATASAQGRYSPGGANAYVRAQNWNGLVQYSRAWTAAEANSATAWYYLGTAYFMGLHRPADAVGPLQKAVALNPGWTVAWNGLGFALMDLKRYDEAAHAFQKCVDQAPAQSSYWNSLASAYSWEGKPQLAFQTLERQHNAVARSATYADWYNLANGFASLGRKDEAKPVYAEALRLNPRYGPAWNNLGVAEQALGNFNNALEDYRRAAALGDPLGSSNAAALQSGLASAQQRSGGHGVNLRMVPELVRAGQAHAWLNNHPGALGTPFGHP